MAEAKMKHKNYEDYKKKVEEFEASGGWPKDLGNSDHADNVECTLIEIDAKLEPYGLEVVQYDTKSDSIVWEIVKRTVICSSCKLVDGIGWAVECPDCSEGPYW